tara:strand:- start:392 stop:640 length:249 start_codon:yes stop_codon:yes gene_type:complete
MVSFKTKSGVTISVPGSIKDPKVELAIKDISMNDIKAELEKALKEAMPNRMSRLGKKRGGIIKKAKVGMQMKGTSKIIKRKK